MSPFRPMAILVRVNPELFSDELLFLLLGGKVLESMPVLAPYYSEHVQTAVMRGSIH